MNKTPYQGSKKTYGIYKCNNCGNKWESGHSWANNYQECKYCNETVYPYKQNKLQNVTNSQIKLNRPHIEEYCNKCILLGKNCKYFKRSRKTKIV
jgi:DNA-directed RNA polymerase subunit RPC12/RpoP